MSIANRDYKSIADRIENNIIGRLDAIHRPRLHIVSDTQSLHACQFHTGPVTSEMAFAAEMWSQFYYKKRVVKVRAMMRGAA
jgi:hypothetical protein